MLDQTSDTVHFQIIMRAPSEPLPDDTCVSDTPPKCTNNDNNDKIPPSTVEECDDQKYRRHLVEQFASADFDPSDTSDKRTLVILAGVLDTNGGEACANIVWQLMHDFKKVKHWHLKTFENVMKTAAAARGKVLMKDAACLQGW